METTCLGGHNSADAQWDPATADRSIRCARWIAFLVLLICLPAGGCGGGGEGLVEIGEAIRDDDDDGWFTNDTNQAITLTISTAAFSLPGNYRFIVDDVRFPLSPTLDGDISVGALNITQPITIGAAVAKRVAGTAILQAPDQRIQYQSSVRIQQRVAGADIDVGSSTVNYDNTDATINLTVGSVNLVLTTTVERFADPNPNDANGDSDGDGLTEREESILAESFNGLGDPRPGGRDIYLIVGHTSEPQRLDALTRELLKSRFFFRNINLHVDDGTLNGQAGDGGLMTLSGSQVAPGTMLTLAQVATIRTENIPITARQRMSYLAVLTDEFASPGGGFGFGLANGIPGNQLVMRSRLGPLFPTLHNYQAGVLMHELGHLLGLCHPTLSTPACPSGAIPVPERNPGTTIMGTPAEAPPVTVGVGGIAIAVPNPAALIDAMRRPLDYSQTQWGNVMIGSGLAP